VSRFEVLANDVIATEVVVGPGLAAQPVIPDRAGRRQVVVLTQPGTPRIIADGVASRLGIEHTIVELPDRDGAKRWELVAELYESLARLGVGRQDTIVGVGGGALTDVAGFVASTWLRGIEAVYVPTTVLGAIDAAIGGKTGINLAGKNLVGTFTHPARVVVDTDLLDALPVGIKREGWAEAIKAGFIADPDLVLLFEQFPENPPMVEVVERAIAVKVDVVNTDFRESGQRMILNFGHTIGHGVEIAQGISHGEAVAIGMVAAADLSWRKYGFEYPMRDVLSALGLPVASTADRRRVEELIWLDKKRDAKGLKMVLLEAVGSPRIDYVSGDEVGAGLDAIGLA
jgi:3-dehydroquinate synthase